MIRTIFLSLFCLSLVPIVNAQENCSFKVISFYTAKNDAAHISFVKEANLWFPEMGKKLGFCYEATDKWENLNSEFLSKYQVVIFLDSRPENPEQRLAFEKYIKNGGGWMGFHFSGFALTPSAFPNNWAWYHDIFLGSGEYHGNTWRPTSATLKVEDQNHPMTKELPNKIYAAPNEWYRWKKDLRLNPNIKILLSIDPDSFPLGTGPKPHEIWHEGYFPVVWSNTDYNMVYFNMGHNDIDYEHHTNDELSSTFSSDDQNKLIINALLWLAEENAIK